MPRMSWPTASAAANGHHIEILSGYRSVAHQRQIFLMKLKRHEINIDEIDSGKHDAEIQKILELNSIPGFSRHHTGIAVDFRERGGSLGDFGQSKSYRWLMKNNFKMAKHFGFIPSYPDDLEQQGPLPESWEFLWIGRPAVQDLTQLGRLHRGALAQQIKRIIQQIDSKSSTAIADRDPPRSDPEQLPGG